MDLVLYLLAIGISLFALSIWLMLAAAPLFFVGSVLPTIGIAVAARVLEDQPGGKKDFDEIIEEAVNPSQYVIPMAVQTDTCPMIEEHHRRNARLQSRKARALRIKMNPTLTTAETGRF